MPDATPMSSSAMSFTSSSQKSVPATKTSALADFIASTGPEDLYAKQTRTTTNGRAKADVKSALSQGKSLRQKISRLGLFSKSSSSSNKQQKHVSIQPVALPSQIPTAPSRNSSSTSARHVSIKVDYAALYKPEAEVAGKTAQHRRQASGQSSSSQTEDSIFSYTGDKDDSTTLSSLARQHHQQQQRTASGSASSSGYSYIPSSTRRLMRTGSGGGSSTLDAAATTMNSPSSIRHPPPVSVIEEEANTTTSQSSSPSKLMESLAQLQMMRSQHHTAAPVSPPPAGPAPSTSKDLPPPPSLAPPLRVASPVPSLSQRRLLARNARRRDLMDEQERRLDESVNVLRKELEEGDSSLGDSEAAATTEPPGWTMSTPQTVIDCPPPPEELHVVIGDVDEDTTPTSKRPPHPLQLVPSLDISKFPPPATAPLAASSPAGTTERSVRSKGSQQQLASSTLLPTPEESPVRTNEATTPPPISHHEAAASSPKASTSSKQMSIADDRLRALEEKNWILEQALRVLIEKDLAKDSARH